MQGSSVCLGTAQVTCVRAYLAGIRQALLSSHQQRILETCAPQELHIDIPAHITDNGDCIPCLGFVHHGSCISGRDFALRCFVEETVEVMSLQASQTQHQACMSAGVWLGSHAPMRL